MDICNELLTNKTLSLKSKGLWFMLPFLDEAIMENFSYDKASERFGCNYSELRKGLLELQSVGLIEMKRYSVRKGQKGKDRERMGTYTKLIIYDGFNKYVRPELEIDLNKDFMYDMPF